MTRILLVEDETHILTTVKLNLEMEGYEVVTAQDGLQASKIATEQRFDLLLLDVMLPEVDGWQICQQVRLHNREVPIIFLTARDAQQDRIKGLRLGADDYLTKPFSLEELLLRVKNVLKRTHTDVSEQSKIYTIGEHTVNFATYEAKGNQGSFTLTKKEALLLQLLIDRKNEVVSRREILETVWGYDVYPSTRTIDNFILAFRKYFEEDPKNPVRFLSVRGVGYKFKE